MKVIGEKMKLGVALLIVVALLFGVLPMKAGGRSRAAEQPAPRNPRILKTTQEVAPGSGGQKELKNPTTENGITTWDSIWFGNYWQEDTNGDGKADKNDEKQPIKWRVLSVDGDDVFLLADKNMDVQWYNNKITDDVTWETCTMRSWLNGYGAGANSDGKDCSDNNFFDNAFTEEEQSKIKTTNVVNNDNPEYNTEGGNGTSDPVYLLSIDEVMNPAYGFTSDTGMTKMREAVNTSYVAGGGEIKSHYVLSAGDADDWWLRSPGLAGGTAAEVGSSGIVGRDGSLAYMGSVGVRPALHLNLSSNSSWSYAGTVIPDNMAEWDCVWFGNYWQEDTNADGKADKDDAKTPIKWRVLSVSGDDAFLAADKNLDVQRYNDTDTSVTWETCTMRSWLNGYGAEANKEGKDYSSDNFLINAFSAGERSAIRMTNVVNNDNSKYDTEGGNDTSDQVYLLSLDEVMNPAYGFASNTNMTKMREAVNSSYVAGGGEIKTDEMRSVGRTDNWRLRSPGDGSNYVAYVIGSGGVHRTGGNVNDDSVGVRPALHLNLSSTSSWSYAGIVTSEGGDSAQAGESTAKPSAKPSMKPDAGSTSEASSKPIVTLSASPATDSIGKVSAVKLKQKKQDVTVSWKKVSGAAGYQICYSTSKKWKNKKQKLTKKNKLIVKKLNKKKAYYFRVRAYRMNGAKKVYGAWSKKRKFRMKK